MNITGYKDKHEYTNKNGVTSVVYLMDCMELLKQVPDKYFELAVVDPPYGIGINGSVGGVKLAKVSQYKKSGWDNKIPTPEYFRNLFNVSTNQIIWGGNYMIENLLNTSCFLIWDKNNSGNFADAELAWTSFKTAVRIFKYTWNGMLQENMKNKEVRIHETQKPQQLYEWLFKNYAKEGDKILDTHLGSASSRIAADKANLPFVGCELDSDYFYASVKRFNDYTAQGILF